jgi:dephospho-CoA kinase|tara:strand:- start:2788 stop:3432 length:645 start_codon:yes stop_codon:yes gene_type:complete
MIIALTGKNASGKSEVAEYLKTKGFVYYSLSDVLREEATKRGLEHSRDNLTKLGNGLREKFGASYLAAQINKKIKQQLKSNNRNSIIKKNNGLINNNGSKINEKNNNETNFVIDSIRSPYEAKELMKNKDFILIGIDVPVELCFKRLLERNRVGDAKTLEAFKQQEQRENLNNTTNQQLDETFKLAEKVIVNDGTLEELHKKVDDLLLQLKNKH